MASGSLQNNQHQRKKNSLRIATWNLRFNAGASQWPGLWNRIGLDLLFLQESEKPVTEHVCHWECVQGYSWGSAIVLRSGRVEPIAVPDCEGWVVGGEVLDSCLNSDGIPLFVFSLHSPSPFKPSKEMKRKSYIKEVDAIISHVKGVVPPNSEILIGGDFNFTIGERQPGEFQKTKKAERAFIQRMADLGLFSCWSASHPDLPLEQTLRWASDKAAHKATPFHCDGKLCSKPSQGRSYRPLQSSDLARAKLWSARHGSQERLE